MKRRPREPGVPKKRRTTLTLPADSLEQVERIARTRRVNLSTVVDGSRLGMPLIHNNAADFEWIRSAIERSPDRFPNLGPLVLIRCASVA